MIYVQRGFIKIENWCCGAFIEEFEVFLDLIESSLSFKS